MKLSRKVSHCWTRHCIFIVLLLGTFSYGLVLQSAEA